MSKRLLGFEPRELLERIARAGFSKRPFWSISEDGRLEADSTVRLGIVVRRPNRTPEFEGLIFFNGKNVKRLISVFADSPEEAASAVYSKFKEQKDEQFCSD